MNVIMAIAYDNYIRWLDVESTDWNNPMTFIRRKTNEISRTKENPIFSN